MQREKGKKAIFAEIWKAKYLYLMLLPFLAWLIVFKYGPMYGVIIAFKDYTARLGIWGSEWVGLKHFVKIFSTPKAMEAIINTVIISFGRLIFEFPIGIIIAILLAEMPGRKVKKVYQTLFTFPHFLSWVVVATILKNFLSLDGPVNQWLMNLGVEPVSFLGTNSLFRPLLYITANWKEMGWSAIIFIAAIAGIDPTLYEAAEIDGASRLQRIWHVTLPGIRTTIVVMLILAVGGIMNAGFEQVFNLRNAMTADAARMLDTYVYDITFSNAPNYSFSSAVGLFKSVINLLLLLTANKLSQKLTGSKAIG